MDHLSPKDPRTLRYRHDEGGRVIDVEVEYKKGGMNHFQGVTMPRGVYVSVSPYSRDNGYLVATAFSGLTTCVAQVGRFSPKKLNEVAEAFDPFVPELVQLFTASGKGALSRRIAEISSQALAISPAA